jgi:hypothetical protein
MHCIFYMAFKSFTSVLAWQTSATLVLSAMHYIRNMPGVLEQLAVGIAAKKED